jgi:hemerythrin-like metal-binding protein
MIKKFVWTPEYSVDVKEIDEQHKEFFNIINVLLEASESDSISKEMLLMKIGLLGNYAAYHLGTEESLFDQFKYDGAVKHIEAHNMFRVKIKELITKAETESVNQKEIIQEAANFAGDWLLNHILIVDKQYSKFFNEHGLK